MNKKLSNKQKGLMVVMCVATSAMLTACVNDNNNDEKDKNVSAYSKSMDSTKSVPIPSETEKVAHEGKDESNVDNNTPKITKLAAKSKRSKTTNKTNPDKQLKKIFYTKMRRCN